VPEPTPPPLAPPGPGRRFAASRPVRIADVLPSGRVRLDALARYLQDVATDDGEDAGIDRHLAWVVRKTTMHLQRRPVMGERLELITWASATGARWAERRTTIRSTVDNQPVVETAATWVCIDRANGRPAQLSDRFWEMYGEAVGSRSVSPRLVHPDPPADNSVTTETWPLRATDFDVFDHVNNAAIWMPVEHRLYEGGLSDRVGWAEMEYRSAIEPNAAVTIASELGGHGVEAPALRLWLTAGGKVQATAVVGLVGSG
jgi:acyl-ACP thioesterase